MGVPTKSCGRWPNSGTALKTHHIYTHSVIITHYILLSNNKIFIEVIKKNVLAKKSPHKTRYMAFKSKFKLLKHWHQQRTLTSSYWKIFFTQTTKETVALTELTQVYYRPFLDNFISLNAASRRQQSSNHGIRGWELTSRQPLGRGSWDCDWWWRSSCQEGYEELMGGKRKRMQTMKRSLHQTDIL